MPPTIIEHKLHYNKPDQTFVCDLLRAAPGTVLLRYVTTQPYTVAGEQMTPGSSTLGLYHDGDHHVFWKMLRPDGSLHGYLIHLCEPIRLHHDQVVYRDLMLDVWYQPPHPPRLLDEDDLADALAAGTINEEKAAEARSAAANVLSRLPEIVRQAELEIGT
jgi:predicted RNA-binding protein associated with RNAse of E/G family